MIETVYYEDENVAITDQSVKLGEKVYVLRDVRYVGVVPELGQSTARNTPIWLRLLVAFLFILGYMVLVYIVHAYFFVTFPLRGAIFLLFLYLAFMRLFRPFSNSRRPYLGYLSIRLPDGFESTFPPTDKEYLESIAKTINAAVVEDRKAKKLRRPDSSMAR